MTPTPFVFRELDVSDSVKVELSGADLPFARPHDTAGFHSGGQHKHKRTKLPGRRDPLFHMLTPDDEPLEVQGAFRDFRVGAGHADGMVAKIERVRDRGNLLRISWNGKTWTGILDTTDFGHEGVGHVTYRLVFAIGTPHHVGATPQPAEERGDSDAVTRVRLALLARHDPPAATVAGLLSVLDSALRAVDEGMQTLEDETRRLEVIRDNAAAQARRVTSIGAQVQSRIQHASRFLGGLRAAATTIGAQVQDASRWETYQHSVLSGLRDAQRVAWAAALRAHKQAAALSRLYRVRDGDTLESIAREHLSDPARAADLGLQPHDLVVGRIVRIPAQEVAA